MGYKPKFAVSALVQEFCDQPVIKIANLINLRKLVSTSNVVPATAISETEHNTELVSCSSNVKATTSVFITSLLTAVVRVRRKDKQFHESRLAAGQRRPPKGW